MSQVFQEINQIIVKPLDEIYADNCIKLSIESFVAF